MKTISLKRNESFSIRDGWFEKALNSITSNNINIFQGNDGISILGIGSNMVKSLKYWIQAANIIEKRTMGSVNLTEFGTLLLQYDNYLEDNFSWQLIHYFLSSNMEFNPVFNIAFNDFRSTFSKKDLIEIVSERLARGEYKFNSSLIDNDVSVFLRTYYSEEKITNPEDNFTSPLVFFKLLTKSDNKFKKIKPAIKNVNYLVVYYVLTKLYDNQEGFNIDESMHAQNSPMRLFCLDKNMYLHYLDQLKNKKLITINKTAGINAAYFNETLTLEQIFEHYFETEE